MRFRPLRTTLTLLAAATLTLSAGACGGSGSVETGSAGDELAGAKLVVGSKDFTENIMLGKIAVHLLQAHGAEIEDKTNLGGTVPNRKALESGEIDL
ncbi:glycine betaine ABC transporter substrate-binding protein, partial [Nonomuraea salmonea]